MKLVSHLSWITPNEQHSRVSALQSTDDQRIRPSRISRITDDVFFVIRAIYDTIKDTIKDKIKYTIDAFHDGLNIVALNIVSKKIIFNSIVSQGFYFELLNWNADKARSPEIKFEKDASGETKYYYYYYHLHKLRDDEKKLLGITLDAAQPVCKTSSIDIRGKLFDTKEVARPQVLWINVPSSNNYHLEYRVDEFYEIPHLKQRRTPKPIEEIQVDLNTPPEKTAIAWRRAAFKRLRVLP